MYSKVKLSKRQIKEDKFTAFMLTAKQQIEDNWQFYVIGVIVIALAVVGVVYYVNNQSTQKSQAAERFAQAMSEYRNGNNQVAVLNFSQIIDDFSGDKVAEQATYILGNLNLESRNYPEAIRYYQMYIDQYKDNQFFRAASFAGLGSSYENQGDFAQAAQNYVSAVEAYPDGPLVGDYHLAAMRNFLAASNHTAAQQQLDAIKKLTGQDDIINRAARLYAEKSVN